MPERDESSETKIVNMLTLGFNTYSNQTIIFVLRAVSEILKQAMPDAYADAIIEIEEFEDYSRALISEPIERLLVEMGFDIAQFRDRIIAELDARISDGLDKGYRRADSPDQIR